MHDVYKNIDDYNHGKENKMIADMIHNKKLSSIVPAFFIKGRKLDISLAFITKSYFKVPKDDRINNSHSFISKMTNKRERHQIAVNHSSDIKLKILLISIENAQMNHILF